MVTASKKPWQYWGVREPSLGSGEICQSHIIHLRALPADCGTESPAGFPAHMHAKVYDTGAQTSTDVHSYVYECGRLETKILLHFKVWWTLTCELVSHEDMWPIEDRSGLSLKRTQTSELECCSNYIFIYVFFFKKDTTECYVVTVLSLCFVLLT